jgi:hypothetical protein
MSLSMRRVALAATATALGIGGALLPSADAMAATAPAPSVDAVSHGTTAAALGSHGSTRSASFLQPSGCGWWSSGYTYNCW